MLRNIIFDMDGVLVDSENALRIACIKMFGEKGLTVNPEDFIPFTGMGENKFIGGVAEKYGLEFDLSMKTQAYNIYDELADEYVIAFEGIKELVQNLRRLGYKLAVASAADAPKVAINLRCLGLSSADFDTIITGSDLTNLKPDPAIFLTAAEILGANPSETLVVEDAVAGCQAAKSAGMRCIGVTSTFDGAALKNAGAEFIVTKTADIIPVIEKHLS